MRTAHRVEIKAVEFDYPGRILHVQCEGHASNCVDIARELGWLILGQSYRWHITSIVGKLPEEYTLPSEMVVDIYMNGVGPSV